MSKKGPLFVRRLSVFWGLLALRKKRSPAQKKKIGGNTWAGPPTTISNQLVAGSIIVRHMQSILEPSLSLRVYGPMMSTHNASQGVVMTSFGGTRPYFWLCLSFTLQNLQDLTYDQMVRRIPFQYILDLIVSSRRECTGCWSSDDTN